ncbi:MAG: hypothetical protein WC683_07490 [bacterium]
MLKEACSNYKKGLHMHWNHQTREEARLRPERDLNTLAGTLAEDGRYEENGPQGPGIYSRAQPFSRYASAIREMAQHIGLSHVAEGTTKKGVAEGRTGPIIEKITAVRSVDFVTLPGRGGAILEAFREAGNTSETPGDRTVVSIDEVRKDAAIMETLRKEILSEASVREAQAQKEKEYREATAALEKQLKESNDANAELKKQLDRLNEAQLLLEAKSFVAAQLKDAKVPEITKARLLEQLAKTPALKEGKLDEAAYKAAIAGAVKAEADYLAKVTESGTIKGMGSGGGTPAGTSLKDVMEKQFLEAGHSAEKAKRMAEIAVTGRR